MKKLTALLLALCLMVALGGAACADNIQARLNQRIATRTGPGTGYSEPGSFLSAGDYVTVHSKVWDARNEIWWVQVEFSVGWERYRAYTGSWRMNVDLSRVPQEMALRSCEVLQDADAFAGPGWEYMMWNDTVYAGTTGTLYEAENGYGLFEYWNSARGEMWRVWINLDYTNCRRDYGNVDTFPQYGSPCYEGWYTTEAEVYARNGYSGSSSSTGGGTYVSGNPIGQTISITANSGKARSGPGTEYSQVAYVEYGDYYIVYDTDVASNGVTWFKIYVDGRYAWISSGLTNVGKY